MTLPNTPAMQRAIRKVQRLAKDSRGPISNMVVLEMLWLRYCQNVPEKEIIDKYTPPNGDPSYTRRIISKHYGVDSSRRVAVRNIFRDYMKEIRRPDPFVDYITPPNRRRKPKKSCGLRTLWNTL